MQWGALNRWICAAAASVALAALAIAGVRTVLAREDFHAAQSSGQDARRALALYRQARTLRPDLSEYWRNVANQEAMAGWTAASRDIRAAIRLNPDNWQNWQSLALIELQRGDSSDALAAMSRAGALDSGFTAHFQLANLAWAMGRETLFWREMKLALQMAPQQLVQPALAQVVHLAGDQPGRLVELAPPGRTWAGIQVISVLVRQAHLVHADQVWDRLPCPQFRRSDCQEATLTLSNAWIAAAAAPPPARGTHRDADARPPASPEADLAQALSLWNRSVARGWLSAASAGWGEISDGLFRYPWLGTFSWKPGDMPVILLRSVTAGMGNIVTATFSGSEPSTQVLATTLIPVHPGTNYRVSCDARGQDIENPEGVGIVVSTPAGQEVWSLPARLAARWTQSAGTFIAPAGASFVRLTLGYQRPVGSPLLRGRVQIRRLAASLAVRPSPPRGGPR